MAAMEPRRSVSYNIMLPEELNHEIEQYAIKHQLPRAQIVRTALRAYIQHQIRQSPTCADGTLCLCPIMWKRQGQAPSLET